jgi:putative ABC transport system permease protein
MLANLAEIREFLRISVEALSRYRLRTSLSVLGVVLGVAAVIAMMSVSEGAAREALAQVDALGLDNLVARTTGLVAPGGVRRGLIVRDAGQVESLVPLVRTVSPLTARYIRVRYAERSVQTQVLGVRSTYQTILRLSAAAGRFLTTSDEATSARACVLGSGLARQLFGYKSPIGEAVRIGDDYYQVVGVLRDHGAETSSGGTLAWHDVNQVVFVPFSTLSRHALGAAPEQPTDEIWLQVEDGERANELGVILQRVLNRSHSPTDFTIVVPRELLAQRYRTQRTFSIVVGSVAVLALLVGGIGIMNIMLASVIERTYEIGLRRTVGATRRDVTLQFLLESIMMTLTGGLSGIALGAVVSVAISAYAGWATHVSVVAVLLGLGVSFIVGIVFGSYPAIKAASLEPIDALRYE